jgi:DNA-binding beta-propeller fold protein YncE
METRSTTDSRNLSVLVLCLGLSVGMVAEDYLIIGVDRKVEFTSAGLVRRPPGHDLILLYEIGRDPLNPEPVVDLWLENSLFGPPTNLGITPDGGLAIVANSVMWERSGETWDPPPDQTLHVIDLKLNPPRKTASVTTGDQPSGLTISGDGRWVVVANRKGRSVSLFEVKDQSLIKRGEVDVAGEAAAVAMNADGSKILVTKFAEHAVGIVDREGGVLRYDATQDLAVGRWPYNVQVVPGGVIALVANNGNNGFPDGHVDTVSVVDLSVNPHRVIDHIVVGDGPEGLAVSPDGRLAVVTLLNGAAPMFEKDWFDHETSQMAVLSIDGKSVERIGVLDVGRFAEGVGFSRDGKYLYVGDLLDNQVSIWQVEGQKVTSTGKRIKLPGHVASLRTQLP